MSFVRFARPGVSPVAINLDKIVRAAAGAASGALMGPLSTGTRIAYRNQPQQDVRELFEEVITRIDAARSSRATAVAAPPPVTRGTLHDSRP